MKIKNKKLEDSGWFEKIRNGYTSIDYELEAEEKALNQPPSIRPKTEQMYISHKIKQAKQGKFIEA